MGINQPKATLLTAALLCAFGASAHAQSSVNISGLLETGVRYSTNQNAAGDSNTTVGDGVLNPSRLRFTGTEDLGGGLKAIFKLESGVSLKDGTTTGGSKGALFGREAYVGLDGEFGKLTLGRQYTTAYVATWGFDPIYGGGLIVYAPYFGEVGLRQNNMLRYEKSLGAFGIQGHYSLGEVAGSTKTGSSFGIGGTYANDGLGLAAAYQETNSDAGVAPANTVKTSVLGGSYAFGAAKATLGYIHATNSSSPQKDDVLVASLSYSSGTPWTLTAVGYQRNQKSADGKNSMLVGVADYALSKRTTLFLEADYNKYSDALVPATLKDSSTGFTAGIRHSF